MIFAHIQLFSKHRSVVDHSFLRNMFHGAFLDDVEILAEFKPIYPLCNVWLERDVSPNNFAHELARIGVIGYVLKVFLIWRRFVVCHPPVWKTIFVIYINALVCEVVGSDSDLMTLDVNFIVWR